MRPIEQRQEMELPPKSAFTTKSVFKADFVDHRTNKSARIFKPESHLFQTPQLMQLQTTQADSYKVWPIPSRQRKAPDIYVKPEGEMIIMPVSRDYSDHRETGIPARSARPRTKIQRGREFPFNSTTSYSTEYQKHATSPLIVNFKQNARECNEIFPTSSNDAIVTSEFLDKYKRHDVPPVRKFKEDSHLFKTSASFTDTTLYKDHFKGERIKCPTEALLRNKELFALSHVNEEGHRIYEMNNQTPDSLPQEVFAA